MGILDAPSADSVPRAIRRRSPATFVVLVVALSVPFWVVGTFVPGVRLVGLPVSALQFVAPLGAALILVVRDEGGAAAIALFRRTLAFGSVRPRWLYLPLLTVLPAIYVGSWFLQRAAGRAVPTPDLALGTLAVVAVLFVVTAVAEEAGWSGYATAPMLERHGILATGIALGLVWALIHVVPDIQNGHDLGWIVFHRLGSVGLRILLVTAFAASGGNVAAAVLMHATDNISWAVVTDEGAGYEPAITGVLIGVTGLAAAWLATRRLPVRTRSGPRPGTIEARETRSRRQG